MLLREFLQNPSGKSSAMFYNRKDAIPHMERKLDNYLKIKNTRTGKRIFNYRIYTKKNSFIFVFKLPSEVVKNMHYDVIFEFTPNNRELRNAIFIDAFDIKVFSNSPHFIFTYAYVINSMKMLFNDCKKVNRKALKKRPVVRNPVEILGFEKTIYVCGLFIYKNRTKLMNQKYLKANSSKWDPKKICREIMTDNAKLQERKDLLKKQQQSEAKRKKNVARSNKPKRKRTGKVVGRSNVIGGNVIKKR